VSPFGLTLQEEHFVELRDRVLPKDGCEGVAYLLCGKATVADDPWDGGVSVRFLSREVIPIAQEDVLSSSSNHIQTRTRTLARVLKRAAETDTVVAVVHGHPGGFERFSPQDDADEPYLIELAQHRNGASCELLSVVFTDSGRMFGRVWHTMHASTPLATIRSVGGRIRIDSESRSSQGVPEELSREALAFGPVLCADIASMRFGVVGCGATGSAVGMLLARLGARRIFVVDNDAVDRSNLGRLHTATALQVGEPKVEAFKRFVEGIGLGAKVVTHEGWVGDLACREALKSCDVVFGCTDDHDGRLMLNRLAYFYLIPLIDMGIGIDFVDGTPPLVTHADSRVTVVMPGTRCLLCRGVVDPKLAQEDDLRRQDPAEYERRRREGEAYVRGGGQTNPAVVTFTTGVACMAIDELIHRLTGYRTAGSVAQRVLKHHLLEEKRPGARSGPCPVCVSNAFWGRGDVTPFLDRTG
jgi:hypothetical protein